MEQGEVIGPLLKAREIEQGEVFRKRTGTYRYLRLSDSSARFAGMDERKVWGACLENGNLTAMDPEKVVVLVPVVFGIPGVPMVAPRPPRGEDERGSDDGDLDGDDPDAGRIEDK